MSRFSRLQILHQSSSRATSQWATRDGGCLRLLVGSEPVEGRRVRLGPALRVFTDTSATDWPPTSTVTSVDRPPCPLDGRRPRRASSIRQQGSANGL